MKMYGGGMDMGMFGAEGETLVLNAGHPLVGYITGHEDESNAKMICEQLYDLAKIQNAPLSPEAMTKFVARSNEIMMLLTKEESAADSGAKEETAPDAETESAGEAKSGSQEE